MIEQREWNHAQMYAKIIGHDARTELERVARAFLASFPQVEDLRLRVPDAETGEVELAFRCGGGTWDHDADGVFDEDDDEPLRGTEGVAAAADDLAFEAKPNAWWLGDAWHAVAREARP